LEVAQDRRVVVLEDNCYYELFYQDPPPPSLLGLDDAGVVLQSGSFSKYVVPGLRMAWVAGRPEAVEPVVPARQDFAPSPLIARALARYLADGRLDRHLVTVREAYAHKQGIAVAALRKHCEPWVRFREPAGGIYLWLEILDGVDHDVALQRAADGGVRFRAGVRFTDLERGKRFLRLCFVQVPEADIEPGIAILGEALSSATDR
jgi:2-aminoadipate transaminase